MNVRYMYQRFKDGASIESLEKELHEHPETIEKVLRGVAVGIDIGVEYARWNEKDAEG